MSAWRSLSRCFLTVLSFSFLHCMLELLWWCLVMILWWPHLASCFWISHREIKTSRCWYTDSFWVSLLLWGEYHLPTCQSCLAGWHPPPRLITSRVILHLCLCFTHIDSMGTYCISFFLSCFLEESLTSFFSLILEALLQSTQISNYS